jgi:hypothetical protein
MSGTVKDIEAELQRRLEPTQRNHVKANAVTGGAMRHLHHVPKIKCADGFAMSVQASEFHYCAPRDSEGPWDKVEVGYPSERVDAFMPFIDGSDSEPTDTVYGYVPLKIVAQAVEDHGGFAAQDVAP